jgi:spore coat polysaccharide biosynthesis protein SpsF
MNPLWLIHGCGLFNKIVMTTPVRALIRCDASATVGYGHLVRCLALADQLRHANNWQLEFAMQADPAAVKRAEERGYAVHQWHAKQESHWLAECVNTCAPNVLILDIRTDLPAATVKAIRHSGTLVVSLDDLSARRLEADLVFYPPIPQLDTLVWNGFGGTIHAGWEWILMPPQFAAQRTLSKPPHEKLRLLVTMGGSDPAGLSLKALTAVQSLPPQVQVQLVIGPGFLHEAALHEWLAQAHRPIELFRNPPHIAALMAQADLALASFGATAYELAALGIPAVYLCLTPDHAQSAQALANAGAAINLGVHDTLTPDKIGAVVAHLLQDAAARESLRAHCHNLIDGLGAVRTANAIALKLEESHASTC